MMRLTSLSLAGVLGITLVLASTTIGFAEHVSPNLQGTLVDSELASYSPMAPLAGRMSIAGSDTMQPVLAKLAMEFRRRHPDIKIAVQGSPRSKELPSVKTFTEGRASMRRGDGYDDGHLGAYDVQLLASSRALTDEEIKQFRSRHGYEPTAISIAHDGIAVYVHQDNPLQGLTLEQVDGIFSTTHKRGLNDIQVWGQLGLQDQWAQLPIRLYGRDVRSTGTLPFFKQVVMLDGDFKTSVLSQPGSASVVLAVGKDSRGIGYSSIGFQTSSVRALPLAEASGMPFVSPTAESVMTGRYPLSRPLYLYVNKDPKKDLDPKILEFLKFVNSREGQETVARTGVFPLTRAAVASNLAVLNGEMKAAALPSREQPN